MTTNAQNNPPIQTGGVDPLFEPFAYRDKLNLSNRVVMAPMTRYQSPEHVPGQAVVNYYRRRAAGEVGLIITEGTTIDHPGAHGDPQVPFFHGDKALSGWQRVVDGVHEAGGKIFPQLWHVGTTRNPAQTDNAQVPAYGPSALRHPFAEANSLLPQALTLSDIKALIQAYARGAFEAKQLGFDGIEIHGAHGYLIDQFFWARTNQRQDEFGGKTLVERTRFATEIIRAVREAVGSVFPLVFRFSQWKSGDYNYKLADTPQALKAFLTPLVTAGVDIFHCSTRRFYTPEFPDSELNLAGWTKRLTGLPVITVGSVGLDIDFLESRFQKKPNHAMGLQGLIKRLAQNEFDLVAVGRGLIANANWAQKVRQHRFNELKVYEEGMLADLI